MVLPRLEGKRCLVLDAAAPFVLLDDARGGSEGRLYRRLTEIIEVRQPSEVRPALARLRSASYAGAHCAGFVSYEAGLMLEPRLARHCRPSPPGQPPLLWFGSFAGLDRVDVPSLLPSAASAWIATPRPLVGRGAYEAEVGRAKARIEAGDIYQVNLTFQAAVATAGPPLGIYAALRDRARAGHGGIVFTGEHWLLSFSPELFFTLEGGLLTARPMKGTAARCGDDAAAVEALRNDPKQRAENLMIVDLLRNDLSRVSKAGSVKVPSFFAVETYPTVHQMTSTVASELEEGRDAADILATIFPCGSVTGAPKIRAMEIIQELEQEPRGAYTGSIGAIAPGGEASFNVAIRTLTLKAGESRALIGLGSGIVADSSAAEEWRECLAKGAFVSDPGRSFDLIETMRFDPHEGIVDIERHLARMKQSAEELGFTFDRHGARNELQAATFRLGEPKKLRLLLSATGALSIEVRPLPGAPKGILEVAIAPLPVSREDFRLRHKTSDRAFYDEARQGAGSFEIVFEDEEGFLTEGSFTNVFVERSDGMLSTPPLTRGLLPGVLRERLIEEGDAIEEDLTAADLSSIFYVGNALRGLMRARLQR